jgi:hypothetical protein
MLGTDASAVITTNGTVNSDGTARALTLNVSNTSGRAVVLGAYGNTAALASVTINATAIALNGSSVNTTGNQTYTGPITLGANTNLTASAANAIVSVANTIAGDTAASEKFEHQFLWNGWYCALERCCWHNQLK